MLSICSMHECSEETLMNQINHIITSSGKYMDNRDNHVAYVAYSGIFLVGINNTNEIRTYLSKHIMISRRETRP